MTTQTLVRVISFGYGHTGALDDDGRTVLEPPTADLVLDLRRCLYNPHRNPAMRYATGLDEEVYAYVLDTPGARLLALNTAVSVHMMVREAQPEVFIVATGCAGGRHRAVGMARAVHEALARLADGAYRLELVHRDVHRQVLPSSKHV